MAELWWEQLKSKRKNPSGSLAKAQQPFSCQPVDDLLAFLDEQQEEETKSFLCVVVNNIDGPGLRDSESQLLLARIAACSHVRIIASIDHVNAPLCKHIPVFR